MELTSILQYLGLSSSVVIAVGVVWYVIRRVIRSKCVRGTDGGLHLDLSLNTAEITAIQNDEELKKMVIDLKNEISRKSERRMSQVKQDKPTEVNVV